MSTNTNDDSPLEKAREVLQKMYPNNHPGELSALGDDILNGPRLVGQKTHKTPDPPGKK